jgi:hypothetical protein
MQNAAESLTQMQLQAARKYRIQLQASSYKPKANTEYSRKAKAQSLKSKANAECS